MVTGKMNGKIQVIDRYRSFELSFSTGIFGKTVREEILFLRILYSDYVPSFRLQPLSYAT